MNVLLVIPTYNGGKLIKECINAIKENLTEWQKSMEMSILLIDSSSQDGTDQYLSALPLPFSVLSIPTPEFDHGATRNLGLFLSERNDITIFLTQDAILNSAESLPRIVKIFTDPSVAIAYGKQLPHCDANPIASHARSFNYQHKSYIADNDSKKELGLKTVFNSNSFAAYKVSVFRSIGGFPSNIILAEDMFLAAKAVMNGYKIAYVAEAEVRHSHNYSPLEEGKRYFDIGVFHSQHDWIEKEFGGTGREGWKFIISEFRFLLKCAPLWIPRACLTNFLKFAGYKLGQNFSKLPKSWVKRMSMHQRFWNNY